MSSASAPEALLDAVRADGLLAQARPIVVLLSGGRDSTCLLDVAVRIAGSDAVSALHLNYGLRDDAAADERHCQALCEHLGVALDVRRPQRPQSGNLQAWARAERYDAAAGIARARGRDTDVAAGHTLTDQAETILYRLASSPSRRALLGMRPREGSLVRPLLAFTREQTAEYCQARRLRWREDATNESAAFARGRIRAALLPALRALHPAAQENVVAVAQLLREEAAVLDELVDQVLAGRHELELARLRALPPAMRRLVVQRMADEAAGELAPGAASRADDLCALGDRGTAELDLGAGIRAVAEYGVLRLEDRASAPAHRPSPVRLSVPGSVIFGDCEVRCELTSPAREGGVLDRAALGAELLVRSWQPGDRISPLGLGGSTSLQDLFTSRRVPRRRRGGVAVVTCGAEIAWVAGVATSERFKVSAGTREAVRLSATEIAP